MLARCHLLASPAARANRRFISRLSAATLRSHQRPGQPARLHELLGRVPVGVASSRPGEPHPLHSCCALTTRCARVPRCKTAVLIDGSSLLGGPACSTNVNISVGRGATKHVLSCLPAAACCPHSGVFFVPSLRGWGRGLHLLASLAQPKRLNGDAPDSAAGPDSRAGSSASAELSAEPEDASSSDSLQAEALSATEPAEGSYAKELLQYISELTAVGADGRVGGGSAGASSEWLVDWLLAFKLGLGLNWCIALPAAGCLLRLVTLPIAIESERDRRQRQLVDPQFSRYKKEMKIAYETGNTQEYQRLRVEAKAFLKKHGIGVLPTSLVQMLLLGLAISLCTPAIRAMARDPFGWKDFALEQPAWLQSLALPDTSGLSAALCWLVLVSTMAAGWMISSKIRRQSPSSALPDNLGLPGISSPVVLRGVSLGAATLFAFYSGTQLPAAALLFLVPALGVQSLFMRLFRLRSVERGLHFVPEGLRPLRQTYLNLMERREPALVATWKQSVAQQGPKGGASSLSDAAAGDAAAVSRSLVELWRASAQKRVTAGASHQSLKTWADVVSSKQRDRMSLAVAGHASGLRRSS
ncbi:hypothetical protein Emag_003089 [Eimeria magna]